uniref:Uncharacterized protein n=1 Tax=Anguilla anguilla TaxID=7936 RepID=A0A0E9R551_ANGAN
METRRMALLQAKWSVDATSWPKWKARRYGRRQLSIK